MSRPDSADVRQHRMIYPNRKPLLISAILVALTSVPTLVVVAAGTVSLDGHGPTGSTTVGAPSDAPVIIEPGSSSGLAEQPPASARSVQAEPMVRRMPRAVAPVGGTGRRSVPTVVPPPVVPPPTSVVPTEPPIVPEEVPSSAPPRPSPSPPPEPAPSSSPSHEHRWSARPSTPAEPRIDDQAWPGWDAQLSGG